MSGIYSRLESMNSPQRFAALRWLLNRSPELAGAAWLILLAAAIWTHTHATQQAPIYDAFSYYWKAYNFWASVHAGIWFNPLNIQPTFRPPGTILMSYPLGFNQDPRGFYFRSVYLPAALFFLAVLITAYQARDDLWSRCRAILTAIFFTSITLPYHFEAGTPGGLIWGLADPFLSGLAALAAASAWRATRLEARILPWAIVTCLTSTLAIIVKPSGTLVAAAAGFGWVAFGLASLVEHRWTSEWRARALKLLFGAFIIGAGDTATVVAALHSGYLSPQNMAFGKGAIALMRQMDVPVSQLWFLLNNGIGRGLLLWVGLVCLAVMFSSGRAIRTVRSMMALIASVCVILFGIWFWFVGSGGAAFVRYAVPFFAMGFIWLVPVSLAAWRLAPLLLRGTLPAVMAATMVNLALLLLVPRPSLAWQQFGGVGITADFPKVALTAFKALVAQPSQHPRSIYIVTLDTSGAILGSFIDQTHLFDPADSGVWVVRRPLDWQRSATFRLNEIASADALMVNPQQSEEAPTGRYVANLIQEQGVITLWADGLTEADGVKVFFSSPTIRILEVVDHAKLHAALQRMVAAHAWDPTFLIANRAG
jgi:hypothetical protein